MRILLTTAFVFLMSCSSTSRLNRDNQSSVMATANAKMNGHEVKIEMKSGTTIIADGVHFDSEELYWTTQPGLIDSVRVSEVKSLRWKKYSPVQAIAYGVLAGFIAGGIVRAFQHIHVYSNDHPLPIIRGVTFTQVVLTASYSGLVFGACSGLLSNWTENIIIME